MNELAFSPAKREQIRLLVGVAGGTGSGKTYSALRLARGMAGGERFGLIDTEHRRALIYADEFDFDHAELEPPFTPARYLEAIQAAARQGYGVIVVDSTSHVWAGDGGVLEMADAELERMGGRDAAKMASWIKPKREHKRFVSELLRLPAHVILTFRAEPKVEMRRKADGGWEVVAKPSLTGLDGWIPISEKMLPYELTLSFLLMADAPGVPRPIKLPDRLHPLVPLDTPLTEDVGTALSSWALGDGSPAPAPSPDVSGAGDATAEQRARMEELLEITELPQERIWEAVAELRDVDVEIVRSSSGGAWEELLGSLSELEADALIRRVEDYERRLVEAKS